MVLPLALPADSTFQRKIWRSTTQPTHPVPQRSVQEASRDSDSPLRVVPRIDRIGGSSGGTWFCNCGREEAGDGGT